MGCAKAGRNSDCRSPAATWWPGPGRAAWPRRAWGSRSLPGSQGGDHTSRVAGEKVGGGPLSYCYYFPLGPTKAAGPAPGRVGWATVDFLRKCWNPCVGASEPSGASAPRLVFNLKNFTYYPGRDSPKPLPVYICRLSFSLHAFRDSKY